MERNNPTMRMSMGRLTHLTKGFSKKVENHTDAVAPRFIQHNFGRIHETRHVPPALDVGLTDLFGVRKKWRRFRSSENAAQVGDYA